MYWFDWFFVGGLVVAALVLSVLRGIAQLKSGAAKANGAWVLFLIVLLTALMLAIASGKLNDLLTI